MVEQGEIRPTPPTLADDIAVIRGIPQGHFPDPYCRCVGCSANRVADAAAPEPESDDE